MISKNDDVEQKIDEEKKETFNGADRLAVNFERANVWKYLRNAISEIKTDSDIPLINSGIGKPNFDAPDFVLNAAKTAISDGYNQYVSPMGAPSLLNELARIYSKRFKHLNIELNGKDNIQASKGSAGAYDVIARAFLNPNDEVVILEPIWAYYIHQSSHFGGITKSIRLNCIYNEKNNKYEWKLDINKLKNTLNKNTKFLVLNTPHNPTGFVLGLSQMKQIEKLLIEQYPQILVITDEVYEYMVYDTDKDKQHYCIASISNAMWQRTITISSASKTFSVTGWRIGWIVCNKDLMKYIRVSGMSHCGSGTHPLEVAIGTALKIAENEYKGKDNYYVWLKEMYENKCNLMIDAFKCNNFNLIQPSSTYFMIVDVTDIINKLIKCNILKNEENNNVDWEFVKWIANKVGVLFAPCSAFDYDEPDKNRYFIRVSFCIKDDDIKNIKQRLAKLNEILNALPS
eukprot:409551_1